MSKETSNSAPAETGVIAKLRAYRESHNGLSTFVMPKTVVTVVYPEFVSHGDLSRCMRMAKNDAIKAQSMYICKHAKFDGETITLTDFEAFIPMTDIVSLHAEIFDDEDEDEAGE